MHPSKTVSLRLATIALAAWFAAMDAASAQDAVREYQIAQQSLGHALREFALASNLDLLFSPDLVAGKRSPKLDGKFTVNEGLRTLLHGSGLEFSVSGSRVVISEAKPAPARQATSSTLAISGTSGYTQLAQAESVAGVAPQSSPTEQRGDTSQDAPITLDEVVVVGSRLGTSAAYAAQPVRVMTREDIERTGADNVAQVLNTLPEVSISSSGTVTQTGTFGGSSAQLRGLPIGTVLVLINGRRIVGSGIQASTGYFDLSTIPLASVERLEVLTTGSSAVYGGDALGGAINIVLKDDFEGVEVGARYGAADGYDESSLNLGLGHRWSRASVTVVGSYLSNGELNGQERSITASDDHRPYGGPDRRSTAFVNPGNVSSVNGQPLPGLSSSFAAVPIGSTGIGLTPSDFQGTAGTRNADSILALASKTPAREQYGVAVHGSVSISSAVELFTELFYSEIERESYPNLPALAQLPVTQQIVGAQNPFNPFDVPVRASFAFDDQYRVCDCTDDEYFRSLLGMRWTLGSWEWELAGWKAGDDQKWVRTNQPNGPLIAAALNSSDPATALNVFQDGPGGSAELVRSLLSDDLFVHEYETELESGNTILRGPLFDLPAGTTSVVLGGEYERTTMDFDNSAVKADRENYAVFTEVRAPLLSGNSSGSGTEMLALSGAVRYDHYNDFGDRTSAGAGLEFRPTSSLLLRASYGNAFKPPLLVQLYRPRVTSPGTSITDPELGQTYTVSVISGGNPSLGPQTGQSKTAGLVFSPASLDLDFSLTYWVLELENGSTFPNAQYIVDNDELYPGRVTRDATGRVTVVDTTPINFGYIDEAGFDFGLSWRVKSRVGTFSPQLAVTNTQKYEVQAVVNAPPTDNVSVASSNGFAPRWKGTASLGWRSGSLQSSLTGRYVSEYRDYAPLTDGTFKTLGDIWFLDANVRYEFGDVLAPLSGAYVVVGGLNLLDELPEYANFGSHGFDPTQYDLRGRFLYAQVAVNF